MVRAGDRGGQQPVIQFRANRTAAILTLMRLRRPEAADLAGIVVGGLVSAFEAAERGVPTRPGLSPADLQSIVGALAPQIAAEVSRQIQQTRSVTNYQSVVRWLEHYDKIPMEQWAEENPGLRQFVEFAQAMRDFKPTLEALKGLPSRLNDQTTTLARVVAREVELALRPINAWVISREVGTKMEDRAGGPAPTGSTPTGPKEGALELVDGWFRHPDPARARCLAGRCPDVTEADVRRAFFSKAILERGDAIGALSAAAHAYLFPRKCRVCGKDHGSQARLFAAWARRIPRFHPEDPPIHGRPRRGSQVRKALAKLGQPAHRVVDRIARDGIQKGKGSGAIYREQLKVAEEYLRRVDSSPRLRQTMKGGGARVDPKSSNP